MTDLWDAVVGVPIDAWLAADTPDKLATLLDLRDNPPPPATFDILDGLGNLIIRVQAIGATVRPGPVYQ